MQPTVFARGLAACEGDCFPAGSPDGKFDSWSLSKAVDLPLVHLPFLGNQFAPAGTRSRFCETTAPQQVRRRSKEAKTPILKSTIEVTASAAVDKRPRATEPQSRWRSLEAANGLIHQIDMNSLKQDPNGSIVVPVKVQDSPNPDNSQISGTSGSIATDSTSILPSGDRRWRSRRLGLWLAPFKP